MTIKKQEPLSRINAIAFIKAPSNENFTFRYYGVETDAIRHIHNMRVQLSKMREIIRERGGAVKPFKMNLVSIVEYLDKNNKTFCKITLSKKAPSQAILDSVTEVMNDISMGQQINTGAKK